MLRSSEEKDKWLYYLRMASRDPSICGTSFEILIQRLMVESEPLGLLKSLQKINYQIFRK